MVERRKYHTALLLKSFQGRKSGRYEETNSVDILGEETTPGMRGGEELITGWINVTGVFMLVARVERMSLLDRHMEFKFRFATGVVVRVI
jgi:hypothetical protein